MTRKRINQAVRACLERCYGADNMTRCVAAYMEELRFSREWDTNELQAIYSTVLRMLRALRSDTGGDIADYQLSNRPQLAACDSGLTAEAASPRKPGPPA